MVHICIHCKAEFAHRSSLCKHMSTAKYCIKQRNITSGISCICGEKFINETTLKQHQTQCVAFNLSVELNTVKQEKQELLRENQRLQSEMKSQSDKLFEIVEKAALKKTTTTTNNQYNTLYPLDLSTKIFDENAKYLTGKVLSKGQIGLADFIVDRVATNKDGVLGYICTNQSRSIFKFMDVHGNIVPDVGAKKLIDMFNNSKECTLKIHKSLQRLWDEYENETDTLEKEEIFDRYKEIKKELNSLGGPFIAQLIKRTYKVTTDGQVISVSPPKIVPERNPPQNILQCEERIIDGFPESTWNMWDEFVN